MQACAHTCTCRRARTRVHAGAHTCTCRRARTRVHAGARMQTRYALILHYVLQTSTLHPTAPTTPDIHAHPRES